MGLVRLISVLIVLALVPGAARGQNYSDIWWDPSEGGWGISLADHGTELSGVLFGYAFGGRATWYLIPVGSFSPDKRFFYGDIYSEYGPSQGVPADPDQSSMFRYGSVGIDFMPPDLPPGTALLSITMLGSDYKTWTSYAKAIQRLPFGDAGANRGPELPRLRQRPPPTHWGLALAPPASTPLRLSH